MIKKFIPIITVLIVMICPSCQCISSSTEYDENRALYLSELHTMPSEYTSSEIKEIESQVELYAQQIEKKVDDILDAPSNAQKKRECLTFILEFNDSPPTIGKLIRILQNSDKADKTIVESIQKRMMSVYMLVKEEL